MALARVNRLVTDLRALLEAYPEEVPAFALAGVLETFENSEKVTHFAGPDARAYHTACSLLRANCVWTDETAKVTCGACIRTTWFKSHLSV